MNINRKRPSSSTKADIPKKALKLECTTKHPSPSLQLNTEEDIIDLEEIKCEMSVGKDVSKLRDLWKKSFVARRKEILDNPKLTTEIFQEYPLYHKSSFVSLFFMHY